MAGRRCHNWLEEATKIALLQFEKCRICDGFYGSNFGQPVCATCHIFLFPQAILDEDYYKRLGHLEVSKDESEDSGTEEPVNARDFYEGRVPEGGARAADSDEDIGWEMAMAGLPGDPDYIPHARVPPLNEDQPSDEDLAPNEEPAGVHQRMNRLRLEPFDNENNLLDIDIDIDAHPEEEDDRQIVELVPPASPAHAEPRGAERGDNEMVWAFREDRCLETLCRRDGKSGNSLAEQVNSLAVYKGGPDAGSAPSSGENVIDELPTEVMVKLFSYLDDVSLYASSEVSARWHSIISSESRLWVEHTKRRWPLCKPQYAVDSWMDFFGRMLKSAPCRRCVERMKLNVTQPIMEDSWRHRRLVSELKSLRCDPPEGIFAKPLDNKCVHWQATISGPRGSPYEGGTFYIYLQIPQLYPMRPPYVQFITRVYHPNVSCHGDIGIDSIQHNWSLALTISKILLSIQSLLTDPFTEVSMEPAIARLYEGDRETFNRFARLWTWQYAMTDSLPPEMHYVD